MIKGLGKSKIKKAFFCTHCGYQSPKWLGKCPSCNEWNTFVEEIIQQENKQDFLPLSNQQKQPVAIQDINPEHYDRIFIKDSELSRVLGGGIVPGSVILFAGEPGIGKSTLMMQLALSLHNVKVMYVSGEESDLQIKMRADRLSYSNPQCFIFTETDLSLIFQALDKIQPQLLIVDSVQTLESPLLDSPQGSVSQIKETVSQLIKYAKTTGVPVFIIGHVTKEGSIAGPKILEHMVDVVLQFEGDMHYAYRIVRGVKNRFGSANELGIYEMGQGGLKPVDNPSEILLGYSDIQLSGITVGCTMEGMRPMLIETQALVSSAVYGTPQRSSTGFDLRRLNMLLAVLEKRCGFKISMKDVFLNIAGGFKVDDPSMDLPVICSIFSSNLDIPIDKTICFAAEVGLSGEIRPVNMTNARIKEAAKLGFKQFMLSEYNKKNIEEKPKGIDLIFVKTMQDVLKQLFG